MKNTYLQRVFWNLEENILGLTGLGVIYRVMTFFSTSLLLLVTSNFMAANEVGVAINQTLTKPSFFEINGSILSLIFYLPDTVAKWISIPAIVLFNALISGILLGGILNFILSGESCTKLAQMFYSGVKTKGLRMSLYQALLIPILVIIQGVLFVSMTFIGDGLKNLSLPLLPFILDMIGFTIASFIRTFMLLMPFFYFTGESFMNSVYLSFVGVKKRFWLLFLWQMLIGLILNGMHASLVNETTKTIGLSWIFVVTINVIAWSMFSYFLVFSGSAFREYKNSISKA
jgi:hypothetical protein